MSNKIVSVSVELTPVEVAMVEAFLAGWLNRTGRLPDGGPSRLELVSGVVRVRQACALALGTDNARSINSGKRDEA
ncbi:hypothetical protein [Azohydromonas lata]|uniref:Uncharacterized protein n=1 Tax=Azohydromonas lata TaxID=45677 RepID=A0ABU5IE85_9BURK|nr:hypothetical protein [Azohydromonas lata]MDZ5456975.1 hypothetical protein [Azohydromonas lata]